jgi:hypothetical protein
MGKIVCLSVTLMFLTASWVGAAGFEVNRDAGVAGTPTPLFIKPGTVVKAEYKSTLKTSSDMDLESDAPLAEKVSAKADGSVKSKSASRSSGRIAGTMAPPQRLGSSSSSGLAAMSENADDSVDLEADLEKDLVLTPPPPKTENSATEAKSKSEASKKPVAEKPAAADIKADKKKKSSPTVKHVTPPDYSQIATGATKPIRKVKPVTTGNLWMVPAGNYQSRSCPVNCDDLGASRQAGPSYQRAEPPFQQNASIHRPFGSAPSPNRFVRDGVTVKLANPNGPIVGNGGVQPEEDFGDSDIFSAAAEIIGMPFAFISSLF